MAFRAYSYSMAHATAGRTRHEHVDLLDPASNGQLGGARCAFRPMKAYETGIGIQRRCIECVGGA